jgi:hypothetical protein
VAGPEAGQLPWLAWLNPALLRACLLDSPAESQEIIATAGILPLQCIFSIPEIAWPLPCLVTTVLLALLFFPAEVPDETMATAMRHIYPQPCHVCR